MIHGNHREMGEAQYMPSDMRMVQLSFHCATEYELGEVPKASDAAITLGVPYSTSVSEVALLLRNELRASHGDSLLHWFSDAKGQDISGSPLHLFVAAESLRREVASAVSPLVMPQEDSREPVEGRETLLEGLIPLPTEVAIGDLCETVAPDTDSAVALYYGWESTHGNNKGNLIALLVLCVVTVCMVALPAVIRACSDCMEKSEQRKAEKAKMKAQAAAVQSDAPVNGIPQQPIYNSQPYDGAAGYPYGANGGVYYGNPYQGLPGNDGGGGVYYPPPQQPPGVPASGAVPGYPVPQYYVPPVAPVPTGPASDTAPTPASDAPGSLPKPLGETPLPVPL